MLGMVTVVDVPVIGGDMDALREHADAIARGGRGFADTGAEVHRTWQGLRPYYQAPETETLLAATAPVAEVTAAVGESTDAAARVLTVYAEVVAALQRQLDALRGNATLLTTALDGDPTLHSDPGIDAEAERIRREVDRIMTEYLEAQQDCAAALRAITAGGTVPWASVGLGIVSPAYTGFADPYAGAPETDPTYRPWGWRDIATPPPYVPGNTPYPVLPPVASLGGTLINVPGATGPLAEITPEIPPLLTDRGFTPAPGIGPLIDAADDPSPPEPPAPVSPLVPVGGLQTHEVAGGHTLAPGRAHVGASDDDLLARLAAEPDLRGSTNRRTRCQRQPGGERYSYSCLVGWRDATPPRRARTFGGPREAQAREPRPRKTSATSTALARSLFATARAWATSFSPATHDEES